MSTSALGYGALNRDAVNSSVSARYSNSAADHRCSPRVDDSAAAGYRYGRPDVTSSTATAARRGNREAPRELNDDEFEAAFMAPPGDDDDHFLFVSVPTSVTVVDDGNDFLGNGDNGSSGDRNRQLLRIIAAGSRNQPVIQNGGISGRYMDGQNGNAATASSSNCVRGTNSSPYQQDCSAGFSSGFQPFTSRSVAQTTGYTDNRSQQHQQQQQQPRVAVEPPDRRLEFDDNLSGYNSRPLDCADRQRMADAVDFNNSSRRRPATVDVAAAAAAAAAAGRVSVDDVADGRTPTSSDEVPLSPRSPAVLSPSGRRSALPVPTWINPRPNSRMESSGSQLLMSPDPLSPVTVPASQQWPTHSSITTDRQRPQSGHTSVRDDVTSGRRVDDVGGPFRRNVPGRASMFEHGSRRRGPPQQQRQLHNGGGTLLSTRRSEYGAGSSYNKQRSASPPPVALNGYQQTTVSSRSGQRQNQNLSAVRQTSQNNDSARYTTNDSVRRNGTTETTQPRNTESRELLSSRETFSATDKPKLTSRATSRDTSSFPSNMFKDIVDESSSIHSGSNIWDCRVTITDVSDIIMNLQSAEWSSRRDGLASLENMFRTGACLTPPDLKKVTEIFTRMFHDPHGKVFGVFVEVLVDFVTSHSADLGHWLPIVLPRLFLKLGTSDLRPSLLTKIQKALEAVCESFASDLQLEVLARFITDQAQTCGPKVKEAVLNYLHELVLDMDTQELVNGPTLQTLLLRVVMWSADPQSAEVRNLALAVVTALFNVNSPEFVLAMTSQPKGVQDMVSRVLKAHMFSSPGDDHHHHQHHQPGQPAHHRLNADNVHFTNGVCGDVTVVVGPDRNGNQRQNVRKTISAPPPVPSPGKAAQRSAVAKTSSVAQPPADTAGGRHARVTRPAAGQVSPGRTSLLPRVNQTEEAVPVVRGGKSSTNHRRACLSVDSGVTTGDSSPETKNSPTFDNIPEHEADKFEVFDSTTVIGYCSRDVPTELNIDGNPSDRRRQWLEIVQILSDGNARSENRKLAMRELIDWLPADCARISQSTVKCLLVVLLSATEGYDEVSVLASECGAMLLDSGVLPSRRCRLLTEIVELGLFPVNLAALQLLKERLDVVGDVSQAETLSVITAGLIKAYEDDESRVRKASIDVLVKLYENVGELIWTHIRGLADHKINFLRTKFRRAARLRLSVADAV